MGAAIHCCSTSGDVEGLCAVTTEDAETGIDRDVYGTPIQEIDLEKYDISAKDCDPWQLDTAMAASCVPSPDRAASGDAGNEAGQQTMRYNDGSSYTGQIADGKRTGHGTWQSRTLQYEGQWKEDAQHGQGRQTWFDGRVFEGNFEFGRFSGHGRMVWHSQNGLMVYDGQYREDLKHGHGTFTWADGRSYDGEWQMGKKHGRGTYVNAQLEKKIGYWLEGNFDHCEEDNAAQQAVA